MSRLAVTVLMGGPDAEREVSVASGIAVTTALEQSGKFDVTPQRIDCPTEREIADIDTDVVFPALHGPFGEGGPLQSMLELARIPFVGSSSRVSRNAMDKVMTKQIASQIDIPTPPWCVITVDDPCTIQPPLVLKPINDGSSVDMAICFNSDQVTSARNRLHQVRPTLLAESYVGGREITVSIIDGTPLPIIEIIPPADLQTYDFAAKYERDDTRYVIDPHLPENNCIDLAMQLYQVMGVQDIARVDFIIDRSGDWLLELNTMPGFTDHSLVPMAAKHAGVEMPELCAQLVEVASKRTSSAGV
jgi:D-alanine-D-alanine ligase